MVSVKAIIIGTKRCDLRRNNVLRCHYMTDYVHIVREVCCDDGHIFSLRQTKPEHFFVRIYHRIRKLFIDNGKTVDRPNHTTVLFNAEKNAILYAI